MTAVLTSQPAEIDELELEDLITTRHGVYIVRITPEVARAALLRNTDNRKPKGRSIEQWSDDMRRGKWRVTNQGLGFDRNGRLADGQNRLLACLVAGVPFDTLVATGLEPEARDVVDTGVKRTFADVLRMNHKTNVMQLAGGAALRLRYEMLIEEGLPYTSFNARGARIKLNHEDMLAYVERTPTLELQVQAIHAMRHAFPNIPSSTLVAFESMAVEVDQDALDEFRHSLISGANMEPGDARLALRNFLTRTKSTRRGGPTSMYYLGILVKTWNDWRTNTRRELIGIKEKEPMPILDGKTVVSRARAKKPAPTRKR